MMEHLHHGQRLHQLLSIHFKKVSLAFGLLGETAQKSIVLDEIALDDVLSHDSLRDMADFGSRFRRALNIALQGHIGVLKLHGDSDAENLRLLWERGRVSELIEKYNIATANDPQHHTLKLWKPRQETQKEIVIVVD